MARISESLLCNEDTFNCTTGVPACIPTSWVCDGHNECIDGSDEEQTICGKLHIEVFPYILVNLF